MRAAIRRHLGLLSGHATRSTPRCHSGRNPSTCRAIVGACDAQQASGDARGRRVGVGRDLECPIACTHDVARLEVAVDDAKVVDGLRPCSNLEHPLNRLDLPHKRLLR